MTRGKWLRHGGTVGELAPKIEHKLKKEERVRVSMVSELEVRCVVCKGLVSTECALRAAGWDLTPKRVREGPEMSDAPCSSNLLLLPVVP